MVENPIITVVTRPLTTLSSQTTLRSSEGGLIHLLVFADGLLSVIARPPVVSDALALALGRFAAAHPRADLPSAPPQVRGRRHDVDLVDLNGRAAVYLRRDPVMPIAMVAVFVPEPPDELLREIGRVLAESAAGGGAK